MLEASPAAALTTQLPAPSSDPGHSVQQELRYCNFEDFIGLLGIDQAEEPNNVVTTAAQHMFAAPLPPQWSEQVDEASSRVYFFNRSTGESLWMHPQETIFKEIIEEVRAWRREDSIDVIFARADEHLRAASRRAVEALEQWSSYDAPQGPEDSPEFSSGGEGAQCFYFNATTGDSSWADPRQPVEFDLRQRHTILGECISAFKVLALPSDSSDVESSALDASFSLKSRQPTADGAGVQAFVQNLGELLGTLSLPLRQVATPLDAIPPARPTGLPTGDDTVRSSVSYFSARSQLTSREGVSARHEDLSARLV